MLKLMLEAVVPEDSQVSPPEPTVPDVLAVTAKSKVAPIEAETVTWYSLKTSTATLEESS